MELNKHKRKWKVFRTNQFVCLSSSEQHIDFLLEHETFHVKVVRLTS